MAAIVFPLNPVEDQVHQEDGRTWVYKNGAWRLISAVTGSNPPSLVLQRYDLAVKATTGSSDLAEAQVFTLANSVAGAKAVSFTNMPAGRAMTVVIEVTGNAGAVSMPVGTDFAVGVDTSLSATRTLLILFWNGTKFMVTANIKK